MDPEFTHAFFDDASVEWRQNKKTVKGGGFAYRCAYIHSNGKNCTKAVETNAKQLLSGRPGWVPKQVSPYSELYCKGHKRRGIRSVVTR